MESNVLPGCETCERTDKFGKISRSNLQVGQILLRSGSRILQHLCHINAFQSICPLIKKHIQFLRRES